MPLETLSGEQALARGALEAGVRVITSYPGSPASGTVEALLRSTRADEVHVEWSANEKVALEVAIGASFAGSRALVCVKSVGMNALVDPLMVLNLTGVNAGLVILLGDDPGAYGSQNDQDSRPFAALAEIPLIEPSTAAEAREMMAGAYELSERFRTVVVVRETRSFSQTTGPVDVEALRPHPHPRLAMQRDPQRWVTYPRNAVAAHRGLHEKLEKLRAWSNASSFNHSRMSGSRRGVVAAGFAYAKLVDVVGDAPEGLSLFKLGTLQPAPDAAIAAFLKPCDEVLVLEENEPCVESEIKAIAHEHRIGTRVLGKQTGHVPREGELFRWQISEALARWVDGFVPAHSFTREAEADERPHREDCCAGCPFPEIIAAVREVGRESGRDPVIVGDPGCLVKAASLLDAKYALGSAAAVAQGVARGGAGARAIGVCGDSAFFHSGVSALINAAYQQTPILLIVLDNSATVTSGFQPNPGSGRGPRGENAPRLSIEAIAAACGVDSVQTVGHEDDAAVLRGVLREAIGATDLRLVVIRRECDRPRSKSPSAASPTQR